MGTFRYDGPKLVRRERPLVRQSRTALGKPSGQHRDHPVTSPRGVAFKKRKEAAVALLIFPTQHQNLKPPKRKRRPDDGSLHGFSRRGHDLAPAHLAVAVRRIQHGAFSLLAIRYIESGRVSPRRHAASTPWNVHRRITRTRNSGNIYENQQPSTSTAEQLGSVHPIGASKLM